MVKLNKLGVVVIRTVTMRSKAQMGAALLRQVEDNMIDFRAKHPDIRLDMLVGRTEIDHDCMEVLSVTLWYSPDDLRTVLGMQPQNTPYLKKLEPFIESIDVKLYEMSNLSNHHQVTTEELKLVMA